MIKLIGYFWLTVFLAAIGGFVWLGFMDVTPPQQAQSITIDSAKIIN